MVFKVIKEAGLIKHEQLQRQKAKAKAYNTCRAPQVTYRDFRGAGHVTGQASVGRRPLAEPALRGWPMTS